MRILLEAFVLLRLITECSEGNYIDIVWRCAAVRLHVLEEAPVKPLESICEADSSKLGTKVE